MELIKKKLKKLNANRVNFDIRGVYPYSFLLENKVFPIRMEEGTLTLAVVNLSDFKLLKKIREDKKNLDVIFFETPELEIENALNQYLEIKENELEKSIEIAFENFIESKGLDIEKSMETAINEDLQETLSTHTGSSIINGVSAILVNAVKLRASDIHIEPYEKIIRIRYRIDGILVEIKELPISLMPSISSRIKILANLNISETRRSQDGRFRLKINRKDIDFRMSTILLQSGEKIVLRILDKEANALDLKKLGFEDDSLEIIEEAVNKPYGLILVTGPTGSGKSTTLYSLLDKLDRDTLNISTIEDPIEYGIEGINQVQYNEEINNTFSNVLKAFLRQDPDVIMLGEIRDQETASIAIKSSLTGHLVLSTLHTNDSISTVARLLDMGIEKSLVSSAVSLIIAQRLIRKNCPHCIEEDHLKEEKLLSLKQNIEEFESVSFKKSKGCKKCNFSGFKGRSVIYEVLNFDSTIKSIISKGGSHEQLEVAVKEKGMKSLNEVAMDKAVKGFTSLDEIIRLL